MAMAKSDDGSDNWKDLEKNLNAIQNIFDKNTNMEDLPNQLQKFKTAVDYYEGRQTLTYRYYRIQYHKKMKQYCLYLGNENDSKIHSDLQSHYEKLYEEVLEKSPDCLSHTSAQIPSDEDFEENVTHYYSYRYLFNQLDNIQSAIPEKLYDDIKKCIEIILQPFRELNDCISMLNYCIALQDYYYATILRIDDFKLLPENFQKEEQGNCNMLDDSDADSSKNQSNDDILLILISELCENLENKFYHRVTECLHLMLNDEEKLRSSMFDIELTKRNIQERWKLLCRFHPDKFHNCPDKDVFKDFICIVYSEKVRALNELETKVGSEDRENYIKYHEDKGKFYWDIYLEWKSAFNRGNYEYKILKENDYKNKSPEECHNNQVNSAKLCYEQYKAACKIVDNLAAEKPSDELYKKRQVTIRKFLSLALIAAEMPLESQLYAIGAARILLSIAEVTEDDMNEILKILNEAKSNKNKFEQSQSSSQDRNDNHISNVGNSDDKKIACLHDRTQFLAMSFKNYNKISFSQKKHYSSCFRKEIAELLEKQLVIAREELICGTSPDEYIKLDKMQAFHPKPHFTNKLRSDLFSFKFMSKVHGMSVIFPCSPYSTVAGIFDVMASFEVFFRRLTKSRKLSESSKIRENLNKIIIDAIKAFKQQNYVNFFEMLSSNYSVNDEKKNYLILFQKDIKIDVNAAGLIKTLIGHQFRPDGIAYLLVIIGVALIRCKLTLSENSNYSKKQMTSQIFKEAFKSEHLQNEARRIDQLVIESISNERRTVDMENINEALGRSCTYFNSVPARYLKDAEISPFLNRLQEITLLARLNFVLMQIIIGFNFNFIQAKEEIVEARKSVAENFQFFSVTEYHLSTIENFLSIFGYDPYPYQENEVNQNIETMDFISTNMIDEICKKNPTFSYVTELDQGIDIWSVLKILSNNKFNKSSADFLEALKQENDSIAVRFKEEFNGMILNWKIFQYQYLSLISKLTKLKFELYLISESNEQIHHILSLPAENPLATICLGVKEGYQNNGIAQLIFRRIDAATLINLSINLELMPEHKIEMADNFRKMADYYVLQAKKMRKCARQLIQFDEATRLYNISIKLSFNIEIFWKIMENQLACNRNQKVLDLLQNRSLKDQHLNSQSQFYYYQAIALRKLQQYGKAKICINQSLQKEPKNDNYKKEAIKIDRLLSRQNYTQLNHNEDVNVASGETSNNQSLPFESSNHYNVLSIDGGGIRGIIPAVVLCELERETRKSISQCFDLLAGTSTGGIISLGLSVPDEQDTHKPRYKATDILSIYTEHSKNIFGKKSLFSDFSALTSSRYSSKPLENILKRFFNETKLSELLREVAIPACNAAQFNTPTYFTRKDAKNDPFKNYRLIDVALATSAAPTYFPPHQIKMDANHIVETFIDGGIQVNNPSGYAFKLACEKVNKDNVYMLSLGTGECITNTLKSGNNYNILFWGSKASEIIGGQQNIVDEELSAIMGKNYRRWQYWLENPIALDDVSDSNIAVLTNVGYALVEDLKDDDDGSWNKLIEHLKYS